MENEVFFQLTLAVILGALIGFERERKRKGAGIQTYSLVSLGSCLFSLLAFSLGSLKILDPSPILVAIALGMGFIGAGAIFRGETQVFGLTTAAGLWTTAAIGFAIGAKFYSLAVFSTVLVLIIFYFFGLLEEKLFKK
jgi:putative Mg2+ transporter-C (MgtC) family protein